MIRAWQSLSQLAIALVFSIAMFPQSAKADVPPSDNPILSESFCLEFIDRAITTAKRGEWQVSQQERSILKKCRAKFSTPPDANTPLPTIGECLSIVKIAWTGGIEKLLKTDFSEEKTKSLGRCSELLISYSIRSGAMMPALKIDDMAVVDKTAYKHKLPQRGDIVAFKPSEILRKENFKDTMIKRIIGVPGDRIEIKGGKVYINGKALIEKYILDRSTYQHKLTVVPPNSYFVLGDNRNNSYDSYYWGFLPRDLIIGKLVWQSSRKK